MVDVVGIGASRAAIGGLAAILILASCASGESAVVAEPETAESTPAAPDPIPATSPRTGATASSDQPPPARHLDQVLIWDASYSTSRMEIRNVQVANGIAYALVGGWIATSTDLVGWQPVPIPTELNKAADDQGPTPAEFLSAIAGRITSYDVEGSLIVVAVQQNGSSIGVGGCNPEEGVREGAFVSDDGGATWSMVATDAGREAWSGYTQSNTSIGVATNGEVVLVAASHSTFLNRTCVAEALGIDRDDIRRASIDSEQIMFTTVDGEVSYDIDDLGLSSEATAGLALAVGNRTRNETIRITTTGSERLAPTASFGILTTSGTDFVAWSDSGAFTVSADNGDSWRRVLPPLPGADAGNGYVVNFDQERQALSFDAGESWTPVLPADQDVISAIEWNDTIFILVLAPGDVPGPRQSKVMSSVLGGDWTELNVGVQGFHFWEILVLDGQLLVHGRAELLLDDGRSTKVLLAATPAPPG